MKDKYGREISYLRISLTDKCNLRCRYCMPLTGIEDKSHSDIISEEEILSTVKVAVGLGIKKIRLTGGGNLDDALKGLNTAYETGFKKIKINSVLIGGFNDDEIEDFANLTIDRDIDVRFIELMPMYDSGDFGPESFIPYTVVLEKLKHRNIESLESDGGVAKLYKLPGAKGKIGLISPVNDHFCANCNRIRLTADGKTKPCLHSNDEISIRGLNEEEIKQKIEESIFKKPEKHEELSYISRSHANRNMNQIGG